MGPNIWDSIDPIDKSGGSLGGKPKDITWGEWYRTKDTSVDSS